MTRASIDYARGAFQSYCVAADPATRNDAMTNGQDMVSDLLHVLDLPDDEAEAMLGLALERWQEERR